MKKLNINTKKATDFINAYNYANTRHYRNLWDCYKNPSQNKIDAYYNCEKRRIENNGIDACIIGYNSNFFTYAYFMPLDDNFWALVVETANNTYIINL